MAEIAAVGIAGGRSGGGAAIVAARATALAAVRGRGGR